jgi:hypothetical protein
MTTDPDGHGDMFSNRHSFWKDAMAPGQALDSLTMNFLRFLEVEFATFERSVRKAPNQEEIGQYYSSFALPEAYYPQFPSSSGVATGWVLLQATRS